MVKVIIKRDQTGQVIIFKAEGHAEADEPGFDLVCSAVSAVMQTALLGLGEYLNLKDRLDYEINDGWVNCKLPKDLTDLTKTRVEAIVETMVIGLKSIEEQYSENIRVEEVE